MYDLVIMAIGYLAAVFLVIALFINQTLRFRWISIFGNISFIIYGLLLGAFPIILTNIILLTINSYKVYKIYRLHEVFEFMEFNKGNEFVNRFLKFYDKDIQSYFPGFTFTNDTNKLCFLVLRDLVIANIFVARKNPDNSISIEINFTVEKYRDYKVAKFIFEKRKCYLKSQGITKIIYETVHSKQHIHYLKHIGFKSEFLNGNTCYYKEL